MDLIQSVVTPQSPALCRVWFAASQLGQSAAEGRRMCKFTSTTHQRATCFVSVYRHAVLCELSLLFAGLRGGPDPISQSRRVFVGNSSLRCQASCRVGPARRLAMCDGSRFCPCLLSHQGSHHVRPGRYSLFKWAGTLTFAAFRVLGDILAVLCICLLFQLRLPLRFISLCIIHTLLMCRFCGAAALFSLVGPSISAGVCHRWALESCAELLQVHQPWVWVDIALAPRMFASVLRCDEFDSNSNSNS